MALDEIVREATGRYSIDIKRVDRDRGFKVILHLEDKDGDGYTMETFLSPYVEDVPWTRQELTND